MHSKCLTIFFIKIANVNPNDVQSSLSSDGVLTITGSRKEVQQNTERVVPITQTGQSKKDEATVTPASTANEGATSKVE